MKRALLSKRRYGKFALQWVTLLACVQALGACISLPPAVEAELRPAEAGELNNFERDESKKLNEKTDRR